MSSLIRTARQGARRGALLGAYARNRVSGRSGRLWSGRDAALGVLLLHNTVKDDADRLIAYVEKYRDRITDFTAVESLESRTGPPQLALSFDDGFKSNVAVARRLHELDIQACFYIPTDVIGMEQAAVDQFFGRPQREGVVTWDDLEELAAMGHVIGSHCRQHRALSHQSDAEAEDQIKGSLAVLQKRLGSARHFAWPFGSLRHADPAKVVRWCTEIGARAASGVRGFNTAERLESEGYLRRDAVDLRWIAVDVDAFLGRDSAASG